MSLKNPPVKLTVSPQVMAVENWDYDYRSMKMFSAHSRPNCKIFVYAMYIAVQLGCVMAVLFYEACN